MPSIYRRAVGALFALAVLPVAVPLPAQSAEQDAYKRAADYSEAERGDAVLVMVNGRVVFEQYPRNTSPARTHLLASGTKSFA